MIVQLDIDPNRRIRLLNDAVGHIQRVEPRFKPLVQRFGPPKLKVSGNLFLSLVQSIVYQQLAGSAANKIFSRFLGLFFPIESICGDATSPDAFSVFYDNPAYALSPIQVADIDIQKLRDIGLSMRKAEYIQGLAQNVISGKLDISNLPNLPDDLVTEQIISVRGLGPWTADMFKMVSHIPICAFAYVPLSDHVDHCDPS